MTFTSLLLFCFVFFDLLSCIGLIFYLFVLCSALLISLSLSFTPQLGSGVSWFLMWYFYCKYRWATTSLPPIVLLWIYLFINHILHFLSFSFSHFAHVDVLMYFATTPLEFLRSWIVSLQSYLTTTLTLLSNSCMNPVG